MQNIIEALNWRYATKAYDTAKKLTSEELDTILESARLAPSSYGIEAWKFIVVENADLRAKIRAAGWGQPAFTDASHLVLIARRTDVRENIVRELIDRVMKTTGTPEAALDGYKKMVEGAIAGRSDDALDAWVAHQAYIPLGIMLETAALLKVDATPMEGFDAKAVDETLGLPAQHLTSTAILALGRRAENDEYAARPKVRRSKDEVIAFVR